MLPLMFLSCKKFCCIKLFFTVFSSFNYGLNKLKLAYKMHQKLLKRSYYSFGVFTFPLLCYVTFLCTYAKGSNSLTQKTLLLHCQSHFPSITYVHHRRYLDVYFLCIYYKLHSSWSADIQLLLL